MPTQDEILAGHHYRPFEIGLECYAKGWENIDHLIEAIAIVLAESGGYSKAEHTNENGTIDRGPWQINSIHVDSGQITAEACYDLSQSTEFARKLYIANDDYDFTPWAAFNNGSYKAHLQDASRGAINAYRRGHNLPFLTEKK